MSRRPTVPARSETEMSGRERSPTRLQIRMAHDILEYMSQRGMDAGNHLTERELVDALRVSRSPIRGALSHLATKGIVEQRPNRGYFLTLNSDELRPDGLELPRPDEENLLSSIVSDWFERRIPRSFSQAEFCRLYGIGRSSATRILLKLSEDGIITRNRGHGWRFELAPNIGTVGKESHDFRMALEPGAIRSPEFALDPVLARLSRRNHEAVLDPSAGEPSNHALADVDIAFHRLIGVSSRNRFFSTAIDRQNALRRALSYVNPDGRCGLEAWTEHLEILDALEQGDREQAAVLMRRHIANACRHPIG